MKGVYLLLLVSLTQGYVLDKKDQGTRLVAPNRISLTALDGPKFLIKWNAVQSSDNSDPVLGYKVKLWELPNNKVFEYVIQSGNYFEYKDPSQNIDVNSSVNQPKEILVRGADNTEVLITDAKCDVTNQIRIQAFTATTDGPLSSFISANLRCSN